MKCKFYYQDETCFEGIWYRAPHFKSSKIIHREDGPAIEWNDGSKEWWQNGKLHREGGPATEWLDGDKKWYQNSKLHREDGPAVEGMNGTKGWYLDNIEYTEQDYLALLEEIDSLGPILGLLDVREWVRKRWRKNEQM